MIFKWKAKAVRGLTAIDPYSGRIVRDGPASAWPLEVVFNVHEQLLSGPVGETVIGIEGLALLTMAISGLVYWWPGARPPINQATDRHREQGQPLDPDHRLADRAREQLFMHVEHHLQRPGRGGAVAHDPPRIGIDRGQPAHRLRLPFEDHRLGGAVGKFGALEIGLGMCLVEGIEQRLDRQPHRLHRHPERRLDDRLQIVAEGQGRARQPLHDQEQPRHQPEPAMHFEECGFCDHAHQPRGSSAEPAPRSSGAAIANLGLLAIKIQNY